MSFPLPSMLCAKMDALSSAHSCSVGTTGRHKPAGFRIRNHFRVSVPSGHTHIEWPFIDLVLTYNDIISLSHFLPAGQKDHTCTHLYNHFKEMY